MPPPNTRFRLAPLRTFWSQRIDAVLRMFWPGRCAGCDALRHPEDDSFCPQCTALLVPVGHIPPPTGLDHAFACFRFNDPLRHALHRWKYHGRQAIGRQLASTFAEHAADLDAGASQHIDVVPVPHHPKRLRERGFHPTRDLALALSRHAPRLQLNTHLLTRVRDTETQAGLDRDARQHNVAGAFAARGSSKAQAIWLVDDVITTGATVRACAKALREITDAPIGVVALAQAPLPQTQDHTHEERS